MARQLREADEPEKPELTSAPPDVDGWFDDALPRLFGYFVSRVGGRVDVAEDLVQETVVAAIGSDGVPSGNTPVMAWLYGIARHKIIDHYRREERERQHFSNAADLDLIEIGPSPLLGRLDLDSIHVRDDIVATLDRLPPRQRGALVLCYFDGCDVPSTARLLDVSVHATESLLARGRIAFRRIYREIIGEQT